jgi:ubiquinone biosynthesis monooxygenase Coq7
MPVNQAGEYGATGSCRPDEGAPGQFQRLETVARMGRSNGTATGSQLWPNGEFRQPPAADLECRRIALGAATALMSEEAAMACTDAVETEIDRHYSAQLKELGDDDPEPRI